MYLTPNFELFTVPCYINTQSSSPIVRAVSTHELRKAAEIELLKFSPKIDRQNLYDEARHAFWALNWYCNNKFYVLNDRKPTLLDAAIFAYTCLLWDIDYGCWADNGLVTILHESVWILKVYDLLFQEHGLASKLPLSEHYAVLEQSLRALDQEGSTNITYKMPASFNQRRIHKQH
jgi:metaxin